MIKYALVCHADHAFEGWFGSSDAFDDQQARDLLECPVCASRQVRKQIMAPNVTGTKAQGPNQEMLLEAMGRLRAHVEDTFEDVGEGFSDEARAIHEGRAEERSIYGQATGREVMELIADGVPVAPLPPKPPSKRELN